MKNEIPRILSALASGLVFGFGLSLSGMVDPVRVQGFLDIFGAWDPSLAFVLGGAVVVAMGGFAVMRRIKKPAFDKAFHLPSTDVIDRRLVIGSAIFGIGWGLGGFCPGPAMAALSLGSFKVAIFVIAMVMGMVVHDRMARRAL
ncbi:MAG: protein of unknown function YeeE/YedE [Rhizobium sp.]|nr:protein of unknown function YeeE/YedE [Rhizobium sp.]